MSDLDFEPRLGAALRRHAEAAVRPVDPYLVAADEVGDPRHVVVRRADEPRERADVALSGLCHQVRRDAGRDA